jgi:hypothetical protein
LDLLQEQKLIFGIFFPQIIQDVFAGNCVAVVFVVSIILSLVLPKDMDIKKIK